MRNRIMLLGVVLAIGLGGCSSTKGPDGFVNWYGSHMVSDDLQLNVTSVGLSQIRYELRHVPSDRVLITDYGVDGRGWFLVWDEDNRLWAFWREKGTVVYLPRGEGKFARHRIKRNSPILRQMPASVAQNLPDWTKESLGL